MGKLKVLVILIVIALAGYFAYANFGFKFDLMYGQVKSDYAANNSDIGSFFPPSNAQQVVDTLGIFEFGAPPDIFPSADNSAMKLYAYAKKYQIAAGILMQSVDNLGNTLQYARPDCSEKGEIAAAKKNLAAAVVAFQDSLDSAKEFKSKYPSYAAKTEFNDLSEYESFVNAMKSNAPLMEERLNAFCS
jgi:hypothetical protein